MSLNSNYQSSIQPLRQDNVFSRAPHNNAPVYSTFDRSHRHLTAFDADYVIPTYIDEVYPGDIFSCKDRHLTRMLTPVHPFMDQLEQVTMYFYCPTRLVWNNLKAFFGERRRTDDESVQQTYQVPMLNSGSEGVAVGSIFDYAGIPTGVPNLEFSALPFRAINLSYNEWLRDENLCKWLNVGGTVGADGQYDPETEFGDSDDINNYNLFKIAKKHDFATSGLPWQQKGEATSISIGTSAPVIGNGLALGLTNGAENGGLYGYTELNSKVMTAAPNAYGQNVGSGNPGVGITYALGVTDSPENSGLIADLANVTGFTIADFRIMMQLQALKELDARSGTRYREYVKAHFNVNVSDATLDRPEFLGYTKVQLNVIPVANTSGNNVDPQGNLSAFAVTDTNNNFAFDKAFEEHGYVIGLTYVRSPYQTYQQGLDKMWSRKNKYDFYDPMLANISEEAVKMKEILAQGADVLDAEGNPVDEKTFNFQEAWYDLRFKNNRITGKMRSTDPQSLDVWHLAQELTPTIIDGENVGVPFNQEFIESNTPIDRVLAVTSESGEPQFFSDNYFDLKCTREVPLYSVPASLLGRF